VRPKIKRNICTEKFAKCSLFKPNGIPATELTRVSLGSDELEAIRLVDIEGLSQQDAAKQMQVSRQTFANILKKSRFKISNALIDGHALVLPNELVTIDN
jgi:predicted DNA-binding protein (UPF0251 family)